MRCETYESAGPLWFELGSERLVATKWFCDSLLSYLCRPSVSTAPPVEARRADDRSALRISRAIRRVYNQLATPPWRLQAPR